MYVGFGSYRFNLKIYLLFILQNKFALYDLLIALNETRAAMIGSFLWLRLMWFNYEMHAVALIIGNSLFIKIYCKYNNFAK